MFCCMHFTIMMIIIIFDISYRISYFRNGWSYRLQILVRRLIVVSASRLKDVAMATSFSVKIGEVGLFT